MKTDNDEKTLIGIYDKLFSYLEKLITSYFTENNHENRATLTNIFYALLNEIKKSGLIEDFYVTCDETNNFKMFIDENIIVIDIGFRFKGKEMLHSRITEKLNNK